MPNEERNQQREAYKAQQERRKKIATYGAGAAVLVAAGLIAFWPSTDRRIASPILGNKVETPIEYITHLDESSRDIGGGYKFITKEITAGKSAQTNQTYIKAPSEKQEEADTEEAKEFKRDMMRNTINMGQVILFPRDPERIRMEVYKSAQEKADYVVIIFYNGSPIAYADRYIRDDGFEVQGTATEKYYSYAHDKDRAAKYAERQAEAYADGLVTKGSLYDDSYIEYDEDDVIEVVDDGDVIEPAVEDRVELPPASSSEAKDTVSIPGAENSVVDKEPIKEGY